MADLDLGELHDHVAPAKLTLRIAGHRYVVVPCSAQVYLRLQDVQARIEGITEPNAEIDRLKLSDVHKLAIGDQVWDRMVKAKVSGSDLRRAGSAAFYWQLGSQELALLAWSGGDPGKARTSSPSARGRATRPTTRPAAATTTRRRASGSTTTGRTKAT